MIHFNHQANLHTEAGPRAALPIIFANRNLNSVLDVGCGIGTWLKAALELGITDIVGIDGIRVPKEQLLIPTERFFLQDLTEEWKLARRFDAVLCLEVAEHLDKSYAEMLVRNIVAHSDFIVFSAACPGQPGQHHVNCQWPSYWQEHFNNLGYVCDSSIRCQIWENECIEPWYRQNLFTAIYKPNIAGQEPRLQALVHPQMIPFLVNKNRYRSLIRAEIEAGGLPVSWYFRTLLKALLAKLVRYIR